MRRATTLTDNVRAYVRSSAPLRVMDSTLQEGSGGMLPNALAVLAVMESRFIFLLVKLSGVHDRNGAQDEHEARASAVP